MTFIVPHGSRQIIIVMSHSERIRIEEPKCQCKKYINKLKIIIEQQQQCDCIKSQMKVYQSCMHFGIGST